MMARSQAQRWRFAGVLLILAGVLLASLWRPWRDGVHDAVIHAAVVFGGPLLVAGVVALLVGVFYLPRGTAAAAVESTAPERGPGTARSSGKLAAGVFLLVPALFIFGLLIAALPYSESGFKGYNLVVAGVLSSPLLLGSAFCIWKGLRR